MKTFLSDNREMIAILSAFAVVTVLAASICMALAQL